MCAQPAAPRKLSPGPQQDRVRRVVAISAAGYFIEWYDYGIYGILTGTLAITLFPGGEGSTVGIMMAYGVFALTFVVRPLGGVLIGSIADRVGRKNGMLIALMLMTIGTAGIGVLPSYASIGFAAPLLLLGFRFLQGFSTGGEVVSAMSYAGEYSRPGRRGYVMSLLQIQSFLGLLVGSLIATLLTWTLPEGAMQSWGWRIPFLLALGFGAIGYIIRRHAHETPAFEALKEAGDVARSPLLETLTSPSQLKVAAVAAMLALLNGSGYYVLFVYSPVFLVNEQGLTAAQGLITLSAGLLTITVTAPLAAKLSDRVGRRPVLMGSAIGMALLAIPCYLLTAQGELLPAIVGVVTLAALFGGHSGIIHATLLEMFPARIRGTAYALGYNVSTALFGGGGPLLMTVLIAATGDHLVPAYYIIVTAAVTAIVAWRIRETSQSSLTPETSTHVVQ